MNDMICDLGIIEWNWEFILTFASALGVAWYARQTIKKKNVRKGTRGSWNMGLRRHCKIKMRKLQIQLL